MKQGRVVGASKIARNITERKQMEEKLRKSERQLTVEVEAPKLPQKPTVDEAMPKNTHRILAVDDNRDSADSLATLLKLTGNETNTAYDSLEAIETASAFRPDVILLDIGLPTLDGYGACRRIRKQPWGRSMVIIGLSGWGQEDDKRRSQEAGLTAI
jgi:CheY-like chemotaxis protein